MTEQDRKIDLTTLPALLGTGRLSFGCADRLLENLGVQPVAMTPLSMITGVSYGVALVIDSELRSCHTLSVHPLVNDCTLAIGVDELDQFFSKISAQPTWLTL